jgi:hypothetical protein
MFKPGLHEIVDGYNSCWDRVRSNTDSQKREPGARRKNGLADVMQSL